MKLLLEISGCDPNVHDFNEEYTLLTYAHNKKKTQAYQLLIEHNA